MSVFGAACVIGAEHVFDLGTTIVVPQGAPVHRFSNARNAGLESVAISTSNARDRQAVYLVRSTLVALDQANRTGNYSVLRALGTPEFRSRNSSADLAMIFSALRKSKTDLAEAALLIPNWHGDTNVSTQGMKLRGILPFFRRDVAFDFEFKPVNGAWRVSALSVVAKPLRQARSVITRAESVPAARNAPRRQPEILAKNSGAR